MERWLLYWNSVLINFKNCVLCLSISHLKSTGFCYIFFIRSWWNHVISLDLSIIQLCNMISPITSWVTLMDMDKICQQQTTTTHSVGQLTAWESHAQILGCTLDKWLVLTFGCYIILCQVIQCSFHIINSLIPGRYGCNFKNAMLNLVLLIGTPRSYDNALRWIHMI